MSSGVASRLLVSTEDGEIAKIASRLGAEVEHRPAALAADSARVTDVCLHVLDRERKRGRHYDILICLLATAPMRTADDVRNVVRLLEPGRCDFAMAVTHYAISPCFALRKNPDSTLERMWREYIGVPRTQLPELLTDNGSTYAVCVAPFREAKSFYGPRLRGYVMPRERSIDIDDAIDLEIARRLHGAGS